MKCYVAYSIHGTNAFITATLNNDCLKVNDNQPFKIEGVIGNFTIVKSRRRDYQTTDGVKLHWDKLIHSKTGKPHDDPPTVIKLFKRLERAGWKIDDESFRFKHFGRKTKIAKPK